MQKIHNIYFKNKALHSRENMNTTGVIRPKRKGKPNTAAAAFVSDSKSSNNFSNLA